jgi:hypothetical protein
MKKPFTGFMSKGIRFPSNSRPPVLLTTTEFSGNDLRKRGKRFFTRRKD